MSKGNNYFIIFFILLLSVSCKKTEVSLPPEKKITAYLDTIIQDWEGQIEFIDEYEQLTDIKLDIVQPPHQQYMDKLIVSFSGMSPPDICEILPEYLSMFITSGIAVPLDNFIESSRYIKDFDPDFLNNYRSQDGKIYGFPSRDGGGCVTYIRKDWLDNLGLSIPETWDDFYNVINAFTHNDPDQNGLNDTKGYTDINSASEDWYNRAVMIDARVGIYNKNEKWIDGFTEPAMTKALNRLKRIYQEGLTDPNITTNTTFTARNRFISGDVGIITYWGNHWARNLLERTKAVSGDMVRIIPIPPLKGGFYIKRVSPLLMITKNAEDPNMVFSSFIDNQYDKAKIQKLFTYGVKGYHWDSINGDVKFLINRNDPYTVPFTKAFVPPIAIINDWEQPMPVDEVILPALKILNDNSIQQKLKSGGSYYNQYYLEIEQVLKPDIISRIINGEISISDGLNQYREKSHKMFLEKILMELNKEKL